MARGGLEKSTKIGVGVVAALIVVAIIVAIVYAMKTPAGDGPTTGDVPVTGASEPAPQTAPAPVVMQECVAMHNCAAGEAPHNADGSCNYDACIPGSGENLTNITICGGSPSGPKAHLYGWQDNPCRHTGTLSCAEYQACYQAYGKVPCGGTTEYNNCQWGGDANIIAK